MILWSELHYVKYFKIDVCFSNKLFSARKNCLVRKCIALVVFLLLANNLCAKENYFRYVDFISSASLLFPIKNFQKSAGDASLGFRSVFRDGEIRIYESISNKTFADYKNINSAKDIFVAPQYGIKIDFEKFLHVPLKITAGTLTPNGAFSRFSTPQFSFSSPLSKSFSYAKSVRVSMPGISTRNKQNVFFAELFMPKSFSLFANSCLSFFVRQDGTLAGSATLQIQLSPLITVGASFSAARFFLSNNDSAWFSDNAFFLPSWKAMFVNQCFFLSPVWEGNIFVNTYMQGDGKVKNAVRFENKLAFSRALILASFYISDKDIRTSSNSVSSTFAQIKINPQYFWRFPSARLPSLRLGAICFTQFKNDNDLYADFRFGSSVHYVDKFLSLKLTGTGAGFYIGNKKDESNGSIKFDFSLLRKNFSLGTNLSAKFSKNTLEENAKISFVTKHKNFNTSTSLSFYFKQKKLNSDAFKYDCANTSLQFRASYLSKFVRYTGKIEAVFKY